MKLQYGLKSLMLALMVTAIVAVIAAPFIQPILDDYELVGVQITPVGWVALILLLALFVWDGVTWSQLDFGPRDGTPEGDT